MDIAASNDYLILADHISNAKVEMFRKSAVRASNLEMSILVSRREAPINGRA
jgi:hypothetical protein